MSYALFSLGASYYCEGFSKRAITGKIPFELTNITTRLPPSRDIQAILNQPFYYLAKGSQSFVFESEDGQWVIKFFRLNRFQDHPLPFLPAPLSTIQEKRAKRKATELKELFNSCTLAYTQLKEQCALHYLHLNPTNHLHTTLLLHDKLGRMSLVSADHTPFIIQRKAVPLYPYLHALIKKKEYSKLEKALSSLTDLLICRFELGIADHDPVIEKNAGFIDGKAVFVDIGQFYNSADVKNEAVYLVEGKKITRHLRQWLQTALPPKQEAVATRLKF